MTGVEHYNEAEDLIELAASAIDDPDPDPAAIAQVLARAQVHATLALAAATALPQTGDMYYRDRKDWEIAISADPAFTNAA